MVDGTHEVIAGAVFDLAGYLSVVMKLDEPAQRELANHLLTWAEKRSLRLHNAALDTWTDAL